jgi:hypothetical protein
MKIILFYPLLVQTASMVVKKAASLKSKYQFGVVQDKVIEVPFSGDAKQFYLIPLKEFGENHLGYF